jgi:cob(I)alamin adenosyltransferase
MTMGSIATMRGDGGQTGLAGGVRVSKSALRVEAYGNVDELTSTLGFARSICADPALQELALQVQRELFQVGAALATPPESSPGIRKGPQSARAQAPVTQEMVDRLTAEVHRIEALDGILSDWSVPGASTPAAAFDVARTVCRRAERGVVRLLEAGEQTAPAVLPYLNRLSDLLWLIGRKIERDAGVSGSLRTMTGQEGNRWSRAW